MDVQLCLRCSKPYAAVGGVCRVPHPVHMRVQGVGVSSGGLFRQDFHCMACDQSFSETVPVSAEPDLAAELEVNGARWCFEGSHTLDKTALDKRIAKVDSIDLVAGPNLQTEIDSLVSKAPGVKILTFSASSLSAFSRNKCSLVSQLWKLTTLHLTDVAFTKITLNEELTPNITRLKLQNVTDECELQVLLPKLKHVEINYLEIDVEVINAMLKMATQLVSFRSYKLTPLTDGAFQFASNELVSILVHCSDSLEGVCIWAPRLQRLDMTACSDLAQQGQDLSPATAVTLLDSHPLESELPPDFSLSSGIKVGLLYSSADQATMTYLAQHPRVDLTDQAEVLEE